MNMSKLVNQNSIDSCGEFRKPLDPAITRKAAKSASNVNIMTIGSCGDLTKKQLKHSPSMISREDSVSSKSSFSSLFPNIMRSFDNSSSFSLSQCCVPRPEKTLALFDTITTTLKNLYQKYAALTSSGLGTECSEKGEMCNKVDNRLQLLQSLKDEYQSMIEEKEAELELIRSSVDSFTSKKAEKEELNTMDCERYWAICREMCLVEVKLERCSGKLQFQIMELDAVSRVSPLDQYELSIRLNENSKFKTKIKLEKSGHQIWDSTTFVSTPTIENTMDVKFSELKTLNKSLLLLEKRLPHVNQLILPDPSIYTFWLTPMGTIKLKVIVQWNALLDDPDLGVMLSQMDSKFHDIVTKDGIIIRKRATSATTKNIHNRMSVNFSSMFRSDAFDRTSPRGSMDDIVENVVDDRKQDVNIRPGHVERNTDKFHETAVSDNYVLSATTLDTQIVVVDEVVSPLSDAVINDDTSYRDFVLEDIVKVANEAEKCQYDVAVSDIVMCESEKGVEMTSSVSVADVDLMRSYESDMSNYAVSRRDAVDDLPSCFNTGDACLAREQVAIGGTDNVSGVFDIMADVNHVQLTSCINPHRQSACDTVTTAFNDNEHPITSMTNVGLIEAGSSGTPTSLTSWDNENISSDHMMNSIANDNVITSNVDDHPINLCINDHPTSNSSNCVPPSTSPIDHPTSSIAIDHALIVTCGNNALPSYCANGPTSSSPNDHATFSIVNDPPSSSSNDPPISFSVNDSTSSSPNYHATFSIVNDPPSSNTNDHTISSNVNDSPSSSSNDPPISFSVNDPPSSNSNDPPSSSSNDPPSSSSNDPPISFSVNDPPSSSSNHHSPTSSVNDPLPFSISNDPPISFSVNDPPSSSSNHHPPTSSVNDPLPFSISNDPLPSSNSDDPSISSSFIDNYSFSSPNDHTTSSSANDTLVTPSI